MTDASDPAVTQVRRRIHHLLLESLLVPEAMLELDLVERELIDSADFMELFVALEQAFDITIDAGDLVLENFRTVDSMVGFVLAKQDTRTLPAKPMNIGMPAGGSPSL